MEQFLEVLIMATGRPGYSIMVTLDNKIYYRNSDTAESFNTNYEIVPNEIYTVEVFKNDIKINNNYYSSDMGLLDNKQNYSSFLFARQQPEWTNNVYSILIGRIYMCKIYENEVLQRNFIPCLNDNGITCMYDTVTETTFYNKGSGNFLYKIKE